ncbi:SseB protein N-terminal domain-containing protein [Thermomonospora echinospora]|uniref:SseB protein N-terminal domain-containing protein n=1 Tax=Thermomonospora echinospora TaxID=1992 RepID=A0A1H5XZ01_9ACTN|nr:SseB family protein [Thermomonospora echinospora]SEG16496.1 SseB protein N-terminal domain-containing protein [Thermomonospora echinospora]
MDWTDFAQRLTRELLHLPVDAFVIVQGPGGLPYVQAMRYLNGLHAEAVSSDYLPEPLDSGQELRLSELGWQAPDGRVRRNWWCRVMLPADLAAVTPEQAAECGALADRMVAAFRDVYGVPSVAGLTYEANRNGEQAGPVPMPGLGIPAADAEPPPAEPDLNWAEFTERLARELAAMEPEMVLVIPHLRQESHYVQAFRDARWIRAEAVSGQALPPSAPRFDAEEERLAAAGWRRPGEHPNWTCELPADAAPQEYRRLAAMMVTALRDVQLAASPADLVYEAFVGAVHVELTEFGIPYAGSGRVDARRASRPLPGPASAAGPSAAEPAAALPPAAGSSGTARHAAGPAAAAPSEPSADFDIEAELTAAKSRGDQPGYLGLVLRADLFVPVAEGEQPVTATFRDGTYVLAFTSPEAMDWALGGKPMDYRRTTFAELARNWPRPDWQLAINSRLPSAAYIDTGTIQRTAARAAGRRPAPPGPPATPSGATAPEPAVAPPVTGVPAPRTAAPDTARTPTAPHGDEPAAKAPAAPHKDELTAGVSGPREDLPVAGAATSPADKPVADSAVPAEGEPVAGATVAWGNVSTAGAAVPPTGEPVTRTSALPEDKPVAGGPAPLTDGPLGGAAVPAAGEPVTGTSIPAENEPVTGGSAPLVDGPLAGAAATAVPGSGRAAAVPGQEATSAPGGGVLAAAGGVQAEALEEGVVMQKVLRPDHVVHYLDGGYDWVAGLVYRLRDVSGLQTSEQLVRALGLDHEGSPFSAGDAEVYVIRWPLTKPALARPEAPPAGSAVPVFRIGSQRLPHGAEMFGVDRLGTESFLAVYDADVRGWIRTGEVSR